MAANVSKDLVPLNEAINAKLRLAPDADFEDALEQEVVEWIVVRPRATHRRKRAMQTLAFLGGTLFLSAAIQIMFNTSPQTPTFAKDLRLWQMLTGGTLVLFSTWRYPRKPQEEAKDVVAAMNTSAGKEQIAKLLEINNDLANHRMEMVFESISGVRSVVDAKLFRRINSLNLLLPRLGRRGLIPGDVGMDFGKFYLQTGETQDEAGKPQAISPANEAPHANESATARWHPDHDGKVSEYLFWTSDQTLFDHTWQLSKVDSDAHRYFIGLHAAREIRREHPAMSLGNIAEKIEEDVVGAPGASTMNKLFSGNEPAFEKKVKLPADWDFLPLENPRKTRKMTK
ncbi:hypothetical protein [Kordiimonas sp.]|uniref:hypothetical protein n=1 Tax=Kordiimonas sp. TaxID=1970157 RepID=UPI003B51DD30